MYGFVMNVNLLRIVRQHIFFSYSALLPLGGVMSPILILQLMSLNFFAFDYVTFMMPLYDYNE